MSNIFFSRAMGIWQICSGLMDLTRSSNIGLDSFSDNVRFLFSRLVDTTCGESVEEKQKEGNGVV